MNTVTGFQCGVLKFHFCVSTSWLWLRKSGPLLVISFSSSMSTQLAESTGDIAMNVTIAMIPRPSHSCCRDDKPDRRLERCFDFLPFLTGLRDLARFLVAIKCQSVAFAVTLSISLTALSDDKDNRVLRHTKLWHPQNAFLQPRLLQLWLRGVSRYCLGAFAYALPGCR